MKECLKCNISEYALSKWNETIKEELCVSCEEEENFWENLFNEENYCSICGSDICSNVCFYCEEEAISKNDYKLSCKF